MYSANVGDNMRQTKTTDRLPKVATGKRALRSQKNFEDFTKLFLDSQDIGGRTKENYQRALERFFQWYKRQSDTGSGTRTYSDTKST